jgi:hypothetical protein
MFERLRNAFGKSDRGSTTAPASPASAAAQAAQGASAAAANPASEWSSLQAAPAADSGKTGALTQQGSVGKKVWRVECGRPSRDFIRGLELRGRAELDLSDNIAVVLMNRPLKDTLEKTVYEIYTDPLQTTANPKLPEEMRWLSMYPEVGWQALPGTFWDRYAVLAYDKEHAMAWITPELCALLMAWPSPVPTAEVPFMLMLLRGKVYLRMEYTPAVPDTAQHAGRIMALACQEALDGLSTDIRL